MSRDVTSLVVALRHADDTARRALFRRYMPALHRRAVSILRNDGDAYDVSAGLLIDFIDTYCHGFEGTIERSLQGYLKVALVRRCQAYAAYRSDMASVDVDHVPAGPAEADDPLVLARLERCLAALPPRTRRILRLKYAADHDNASIGQMLGVSRAAISQHLIHPIKGALARLRRCINRPGKEGRSP